MPYIGRSTDGFGVRSRFVYLASSGDTSVSGADANGATLTFTDGAYVDVYLNGVLLKPTTDYNTSTAGTIAGLSALNTNDEVTVIVYDVFTVADMVSATSGGTFSGAVSLPDNVNLNIGTGSDLSVHWDGTDGHITVDGTLNIDGSGETLAKFIDDGAVELYHNNSKKSETTANGIVVGGVTAETHNSSMKTVQVGARGFLTPFDSGAVYLNSNIFYNTSSQWEYATAGGGNVLSLNNGSLYYYHVQNGSDGGTASLVERFVIANNNNNNDNYIYYKSNRNSVAHYFQNEHDTYPYGCYIEFPNASPDNNSQYFLTCHDSTIARLRIYADGDVVNHDNSYGSTSDERLKQDIVDASSQWDDIKNIKIRNFKKKDDVEKYGDKAWSQIGVIAQELETISPKLIRETEPDENDVAINSEFGTVVDDTDKPIEYKETDTIPDGKKVGDIKGYEKKVEVKSNVKAVMYSVLYMKAVKALQEAMTRIETLEAKVKALEEA
tara:strand:- start:1230 stop:2714 length:1485 start_codon:yes stop_codon:yes gene_type:complete